MIDDGYKGSPSTADKPQVQAKMAKLTAQIEAAQLAKPTNSERVRRYRCAQCGRPEMTQHQDRCKLKGMVIPE